MTKKTITINIETPDSHYDEIKNHPALFEIENNLVEAMIYDSNYDINDFLNDEIENQINSYGINECIKCFSEVEFNKWINHAVEEFGGCELNYNALRLFYYDTVYNRLNIVSAIAVKQIADRIVIEIEPEYTNPIITTIIQSQLSAFCTWLASYIKINDSMEIDVARTCFYLYLNQKLDEMSLNYNFKYHIM
jgi:hypothetical protein